MKLSEVPSGTPLRLKAYDGSAKVVEIWGKLYKNSRNDCRIKTFYYEGDNINLSDSKYTLKVSAFCDGEKSDIEFGNMQVKDTGFSPKPNSEEITEHRNSFRIYVNELIECVVDRTMTDALLMDLSEKGFRIAVHDKSKGRNIPVIMHIQDGIFNFAISGKVIWSVQTGSSKSVYGCRIKSGQDKEQLRQFIQDRQEKLLAELKKEINAKQ